MTELRGALEAAKGNVMDAFSILRGEQPMCNVMSITKAAIGLCYHHAEIPRDTELPGLGGATVGQALQNTTGYPDTAWDFDAFRAVVNNPEGDLLAFAVERLSRVKRSEPGTFEYNNLMWQVLASSFEKLSGRPLTVALSILIGKDGWCWDVTNGQPTGPSGLWMTRRAAEHLGYYALAIGLPRPEPIPRGVFGHLRAGFEGYVNGWFTRGDALIAVGWRVQFIVAQPMDDVRVQLVKEDFEGERTDAEWGFVRRVLEDDDSDQRDRD